MLAHWTGERSKQNLTIQILLTDRPVRLHRWMHVRNALAAFAVAACLFAGPACARGGHSSNGFYRASDGEMVHGPTRGRNPAYGRVSAACRDGTQSYSHHHRGTCSGHGGVAGWR